MLLFQKTVVNKENRKKENADKRPLFAELNHPKTAKYYRDQWDFIKSTRILENVAYQMQYLEFNINLYNQYQIYLTIESLLFKSVIVAISGVVEAALYDQISSARKKEGRDMDKSDFVYLIGSAYREYEFINKDLWHFAHELRKARKSLHLEAAFVQEHTAYTIEQANECIKKLEEFRKYLRG